jgi:serine/threonine protein kinase
VIVRLQEIYNQGFLLLCLPSPYHPDKTLYSMKIIKDFCFKSSDWWSVGVFLYEMLVGKYKTVWNVGW